MRASKASSGCEHDHQGTCSCFGVGRAQYGGLGRNGGHAAGRTSFRGRNCESTCAAPVSATGQRRGTCALLPAKWARGAAVNVGLAKRSDIAAAPSTVPRDIYSVLTARAPSPVTIKRRGLAAKPWRAAGVREQACQGRGRGVVALPRCWRGGGRRTAEAARLCPSPRQGTCHKKN
jgi:hypothetical protein